MGPSSYKLVCQRKLGSNTSVLRTNRILRLEMMKGGARLRLDLDEGWCETLHSYRVFWNLCLQIALEWLHDVARAVFWGGSRSTNPCVFPCKVAAAGDERYLVCAAVAAGVGLSFFFAAL